MKNRLIQMAVMAAIAGSVTTGFAQDEQKIVIDGSTTVGPIAKQFAEFYMRNNPNVNITVSESGSGNGAKSLINAACDIATMSRPMKGSEKKAASGAGILPIEHIVAMDGLAVVVHKSNPVRGLTMDQIRDIYMGKIKNWKELGGQDAKIVVVSRDTNSGTYETFESLVMKGEKMAEKTEYVGSNGAARQKVMSTEGAIGYVGLAFTEEVKAITVNGVMANAQNVVEKKYPISRPLYMYTNGRPKEGTALHAFINLSQTEEGRNIIDETGYVSVR